MNKNARLLMATALVAVLLLPGATAAAQEGEIVGYAMTSRGDIRPIRKLAKGEIPFYDVVRKFYWHILVAYGYGERALNEKWEMLGIKPDSPEGNFILKATFRAEALALDITIPPLGDSDKEYYEAQYRNHQREIAELQQITLVMLRELRSSNVSLILWETFLEDKVRPTIGITIYGNEGEYDKKRKGLMKDFEAVIRAELASPGEAEP